jgi:molybdopterin converting factor subunit 1
LRRVIGVAFFRAMNNNMIKINVLLFGACREVAGAGELNCNLTSPADVAGAWDEIKTRFPNLEKFERSALFAVNEEHARKDRPLEDGDTLAIFPPVSGG